MLQFYKDCDAVLRKHLEYQDKIDSSPIDPRSEPKFIAVCEDVVGRYDIEHFRALHYELKSSGLIRMNINKTDLDEPFWRNVVTDKGFHFCKTTSFVNKYNDEKQREQQQIEEHYATVDAAKSAKHSKYAAIAAAVTAIIAIILPLYQSPRMQPDSKSDSTINALREKVETIYSQLKAQPQNGTTKRDSLQIRKKSS